MVSRQSRSVQMVQTRRPPIRSIQGGGNQIQMIGCKKQYRPERNRSGYHKDATPPAEKPLSGVAPTSKDIRVHLRSQAGPRGPSLDFCRVEMPPTIIEPVSFSFTSLSGRFTMSDTCSIRLLFCSSCGGFTYPPNGVFMRPNGETFRKPETDENPQHQTA
jgi:hypothetical protein